MLSSPLENVIKVHHSFYKKLFNDFVLPQIMKYLSKSALKINNLTSDKLRPKARKALFLISLTWCYWNINLIEVNEKYTE